MNCFECLKEVSDDDFVVAITNEDGYIHNIFYKSGSRVIAHKTCLELVK